MPEIIHLNPTGTRPILASTAAERIGVARTAIVSAIHGGHVTGAVKIGGLWHLEPGATWTRNPVGYRAKTRDRRTTNSNPCPTGDSPVRPDDRRRIIRRCPVAAKKVARAMAANGIGVRELSRRLGVSHQAVSARLKAGITPELRDRYMAAIQTGTPNP